MARTLYKIGTRLILPQVPSSLPHYYWYNAYIASGYAYRILLVLILGADLHATTNTGVSDDPQDYLAKFGKKK